MCIADYFRIFRKKSPSKSKDRLEIISRRIEHQRRQNELDVLFNKTLRKIQDVK